MFHPSGRTTSRRIARTSSERLLLAALLLSAACAARTPVASSDAALAIPAMLQASAEAWNRGDLDRFLDDYLDSPETTFIGNDVSFGVDEIRARYLRSYWRTGEPEGLLRFEDVHVRPLGADYALARGRYVLTDRTGGEQSRGLFSLVFVRTDAGWRIIHDHSSATP